MTSGEPDLRLEGLRIWVHGRQFPDHQDYWDGEPFVSVMFTAGLLGHIAIEVPVTPDHLNQRHWFRFEIDQSYLPPLVRQCRAVLAAYPIRGVRLWKRV